MALTLASWAGELQRSPQLFKLVLAGLTAISALAKGLPALANASRRRQGSREAVIAPVRVWQMPVRAGSRPWSDSLERRFVDTRCRRRSHDGSVRTCRTLRWACAAAAAYAVVGLVAFRPPLWEAWVVLVLALAALGTAWFGAALRPLGADGDKPTPGDEHAGTVELVGDIDDVRQLALFNLVHHVGARVVSVGDREIVALSGLALPGHIALGARLAVTLSPVPDKDTIRVSILSTKLDYVLPGRGGRSVSRFLQGWTAAAPGPLTGPGTGDGAAGAAEVSSRTTDPSG